MKKVTKSNYRQYYKEYYGIEFGKEFSVHHIDMNRDNNDISNLLLIPKELHHRLHFTFNVYMESCKEYDNIASFSSPNFSVFSVSCAKKYFETLMEVRDWFIYKLNGYNNITLF